MLDIDGLITDSFAGGGGASTGIEMALGRSPDIAINHDAAAICMHTANHPRTRHLSKNIWHVDPLDEIGRRKVALAWFSPDCKHFSKAKGGKPVERNIRDLAWVVVLWAERVRPSVIMLENVEEFQTWGPLLPDGRPDPEKQSETFKKWVAKLRALGYRVEWRELRACDYGAPTLRKRLFVIARCDGLPIVWPEPTHGPVTDIDVIAGRKKPWRTAAEIIDWSLDCPSIFLTEEEGRAIGVKRPLADNTMGRLAKGVDRYVFKAAEPFLVSLTHHGGDRNEPVTEPFRTITGAHRGEKALVTASFLAQHNLGAVGHDLRGPVSTIMQSGSQQMVVSGGLMNLKGSDRRMGPITSPVGTITAGGFHKAEVRAFLIKYFGTDQDPRLTDPLHTITTKDRFGLVMVHGELWQLVDIGMRMLTPRELFRAQGFPESYIIDPLFNGKPLSKTAQVRMCGNSVSPNVAAALVSANFASYGAISPPPAPANDGLFGSIAA